MPSVLIPLAQGCEELEAVTIIDLLRRAQFTVVSAGLEEGSVKGSRGTVLVPDMTLDKALKQQYDMVALPGGQPGSDNLERDPRIQTLLRDMAKASKYTAAICAAPKVLASAGLLEGKKATSFPGVLDKIKVHGMTFIDAPVIIDGKVVTSRGPGTAMDFALTLIELLGGKALRDHVEGPLQRPK
ncbi:MAG: DJ-1/PfpI family protein [Gammaproteobacteria bacterium]|nr:DJ-1/PfpI family protein [Gammaproteobacteria bacterium]